MTRAQTRRQALTSRVCQGSLDGAAVPAIRSCVRPEAAHALAVFRLHPRPPSRTIAKQVHGLWLAMEPVPPALGARLRERDHRSSLCESRRMIEAMTWAGVWVAQRAGALPDTVFTKQIAAAPNLFDRITGIASGLLAIAACVFVILAVVAAWHFRNSYRQLNTLLERMYGDFKPVVRHANAAADNINYITTAIRTDVQQINATIVGANERLQHAVSLTERRLHDLSALLQVVQEEAEQMFVSTAAAVRGVRTSASALAGDGDGPNFARSELDDLDQLELLNREVETEEELSDGHDSDATATEDDVARPRLRPRRRRERERGRGRADEPRHGGI